VIVMEGEPTDTVIDEGGDAFRAKECKTYQRRREGGVDDEEEVAVELLQGQAGGMDVVGQQPDGSLDVVDQQPDGSLDVVGQQQLVQDVVNSNMEMMVMDSLDPALLQMKTEVMETAVVHPEVAVGVPGTGHEATVTTV
uniref:Uncharacterized protein n=1 Tax=Paramormyrops kingsleyae TaxID=1676925 RepID=A0A3B3R8U9_9TELE